MDPLTKLEIALNMTMTSDCASVGTQFVLTAANKLQQRMSGNCIHEIKGALVLKQVPSPPLSHMPTVLLLNSRPCVAGLCKRQVGALELR